MVRTMRAVAWPLLLLLLPLVSEVGGAAIARGPLSDAAPRFPQMGWVTDHARTLAPSVVAGVLTVQGDTRVYLVQDYTKREWEDHHYMRFDLKAKPLEFTLDLSNVPCGCLACVYLVAMKDPDRDGPNYWCVHRAPEKAECSTSAAREEPVAPLTLTSAVDPPPCARSDMAENVLPGFEEGTCTELDLVRQRCGAPPCVPLSATRFQYPVTLNTLSTFMLTHSTLMPCGTCCSWRRTTMPCRRPSTRRLATRASAPACVTATAALHAWGGRSRRGQCRGTTARARPSTR